MSSNLGAILPSVTLISSLPRDSVLVRVSQLHSGVFMYTRTWGHSTAALEAAPQCGWWGSHSPETQDLGVKDPSFTTSPPCSADFVSFGWPRCDCLSDTLLLFPTTLCVPREQRLRQFCSSLSLSTTASGTQVQVRWRNGSVSISIVPACKLCWLTLHFAA